MLTPVTNGRTHPVDLDTGQFLAGGEQGKADLSQPHNSALVDAGTLIVSGDPVPETDALSGAELDRRAADLNIEGRSSMSADEKRAAIAEAEAEADTEEDS